MQSRLQVKLIIAMAILALVFTTIVTFILLQNQLQAITISGSLQARLTACILKSDLEKALWQTGANEDSSMPLQVSLGHLKDSGLIKKVSVYSPKGIVEASTETSLLKKKVSAGDFLRINKVAKASTEKTNFISYVDGPTKTLQLYVPISYDGKIRYVAQFDAPLATIGGSFRYIYMSIILSALAIFIAAGFFGAVFLKKFINPASSLNEAAKEVAAGDLNLRIHIDTGDELGELADTINTMAVELKKIKARAEGANSLTGLPGVLIIRKEIEKRIKNNRKFTAIYCDLDNLKVFNDEYGTERGDEAIKLAASVLKEALIQKGSPDNLLVHEGGDDFIILATPDKAKDLGDYITSHFDKRIIALYNKEDLSRGYITVTSRHENKVTKFPIMTISLAGVTNEIRPIFSYGEVTNIIVEVKKKAKQTQGSCLVMDQRRVPWPPNMPRPT